jgi:hypothetical protein
MEGKLGRPSNAGRNPKRYSQHPIALEGEACISYHMQQITHSIRDTALLAPGIPSPSLERELVQALVIQVVLEHMNASVAPKKTLWSAEQVSQERTTGNSRCTEASPVFSRPQCQQAGVRHFTWRLGLCPEKRSQKEVTPTLATRRVTLVCLKMLVHKPSKSSSDRTWIPNARQPARMHPGIRKRASGKLAPTFCTLCEKT